MRSSGKTRAEALAASVEKLDVKEVCEKAAVHRRQLGLLLDQKIKSASADLISAEADLRVAEKLRADPDVDEGEAPTADELKRSEAMVGWARARASFLEKASIALHGKPDPARRAGELYSSLVELEEARLKAASFTAPEKQSRAEAELEILAGRLHGKDIDEARGALSGRQLSAAAAGLRKKLEPIPKRRSALAGRYPEEDQYLRGIEAFYKEELAKLLAQRTASRAPRPPRRREPSKKSE